MSNNKPLSTDQRAGKSYLERLILSGLATTLAPAGGYMMWSWWAFEDFFSFEEYMYPWLWIAGILGIFAIAMYQGKMWGQGFWSLALFLIGTIFVFNGLGSMFNLLFIDIYFLLISPLFFIISAKSMSHQGVKAYLRTKRALMMEELIEEIGQKKN